ncbi:hypothetical protein GCM10023183_28470 [Nibribacter koreensis]|uniref:Uncharacterized protein n=1 Tax=Nibribacter koreensis TaxID=1084519 RepID=A0ABP8FTD1_9BACT
MKVLPDGKFTSVKKGTVSVLPTQKGDPEIGSVCRVSVSSFVNLAEACAWLICRRRPNKAPIKVSKMCFMNIVDTIAIDLLG